MKISDAKTAPHIEHTGQSKTTEIAAMKLSQIYQARFNAEERARKEKIWQVLCADFFQKYVRDTDTVLDVGAGYCEFINNIECKSKIALDLNDDTRHFAAAGVRVVQAPSDAMVGIESGSVNVAFASNFFEHMLTKAVFINTLKEIERVLGSAGQLLILQPNIRFLGGEYWDFLDHHIPLTERTLVEALLSVNLQPVEVRARFLPYTTKSRFPQNPWLVKLYLRMPIAHQLLGKQAWVVARKP